MARRHPEDWAPPTDGFDPKKAAYVVVFEGPPDRAKAGWYLGIAVADEAGYHPLRPGFGPYDDEAGARNHALALNKVLGHDERSAVLVVASSMGAQNRQDAARGRRARR
jgi:hypothetical protein